MHDGPMITGRPGAPAVMDSTSDQSHQNDIRVIRGKSAFSNTSVLIRSIRELRGTYGLAKTSRENPGWHAMARSGAPAKLAEIVRAWIRRDQKPALFSNNRV